MKVALNVWFYAKKTKEKVVGFKTKENYKIVLYNVLNGRRRETND